MKFLADTTQTTYSTLLQKALDNPFSRLNTVGFTIKTLASGRYWYCQFSDVSGDRRQRYVGPDSKEMQDWIESLKSEQESMVDLLASRKRLVAMTAAGGGSIEKGRPAKILEKLSDAGVFDAGGLLIGSYAFGCYGNMLGVTFDEAMRRTEDMDIACDRSIEIGMMCDVGADISSISPEMKLPKQINPWIPPYEMVAPDGFKLEFLTSRKDPSDKEPVKIDRFGVNAFPLQYLDYITQTSVKAVILYGSGVLVNVPDPARFALHKLAVSQMRHSSKPEKKRKDIAQASALIGYFLHESPGSLLLAADAASEMGVDFESLIAAGVACMPDQSLAYEFLNECCTDRKAYSHLEG